jgi:hypothetical protein
MEQSPSWEANQYTLQLVKKFPVFMELVSSSPYLLSTQLFENIALTSFECNDDSEFSIHI